MDISCICVSEITRFPLLQRAIVAFMTQVNSTIKTELIITVKDANYYQTIMDFLRLHGFTKRVTLRLIPFSDIGSGYLHAMALASGDIIAMWSDASAPAPDYLSTRLTHYEETALSQGDSYCTVLASAVWSVYGGDGGCHNYLVDMGAASKRDDAYVAQTLMGPRKSWPLLASYHSKHVPSAALKDKSSCGDFVVDRSAGFGYRVTVIPSLSRRGLAYHEGVIARHALTLAQVERLVGLTEENKNVEAVVTSIAKKFRWETSELQFLFAVPGEEHTSKSIFDWKRLITVSQSNMYPSSVLPLPREDQVETV